MQTNTPRPTRRSSLRSPVGPGSRDGEREQLLALRRVVAEQVDGLAHLREAVRDRATRLRDAARDELGGRALEQIRRRAQTLRAARRPAWRSTRAGRRSRHRARPARPSRPPSATVPTRCACSAGLRAACGLARRARGRRRAAPRARSRASSPRARRRAARARGRPRDSCRASCDAAARRGRAAAGSAGARLRRACASPRRDLRRSTRAPRRRARVDLRTTCSRRSRAAVSRDTAAGARGFRPARRRGSGARFRGERATPRTAPRPCHAGAGTRTDGPRRPRESTRPCARCASRTAATGARARVSRSRAHARYDTSVLVLRVNTG